MDIITKSVSVLRVDLVTAEMKSWKDAVASEVPLHVYVGGVHFVSFLCSPSLLKELVVGHLLGEGVVDSVDKIADLDFDEENRCFVTLEETDDEKRAIVSKPFARLIVSACGGVGYRSLSELLDTIEIKPLPSWEIEAKKVSDYVRQLNVLGSIFRKTGGVHVAALFDRGGILVALAEDVGRHNAVDKVNGIAALKRVDLGGCLLILSGRLTGDVVLKAARGGVPIVASLAAAVDSGVDVAEKTGVTLIGFVRGSRMNIYVNSERIKL